MAFGLLYPYTLPYRRELLRITSRFRPFGLALLAAHCIGSVLSPMVGAALLPIVSVCIVGCMLMMTLEIRSARKPMATRTVWLALLSVAVLAAFAEIRSQFGAIHEGTPLPFALMVLALFGYCATELFRSYRQRASGHLLLVLLLCLIGMGIIVLRLWLVSTTPAVVEAGVYRESGLVLASRVSFPVVLCVMAIALNNHYMERLWRRELDARADAEGNMLATLSALAKARDEETGNHIVRTRKYVRVLAERLDSNFSPGIRDRENFIEILYQVAPLHDIGKVGIPDNILLKPGRLDAAEWEIMKTHASIGENVLGAAVDSDIAGGGKAESDFRQNMLRTAMEIAGGHHENWDGSGYPRGLAGQAIPLAARLMSLADTYDALITRRPYKQAWTHDEAVAEILRLDGIKFDPQVVAAFLAEQVTFIDIARNYAD